MRLWLELELGNSLLNCNTRVQISPTAPIYMQKTFRQDIFEKYFYYKVSHWEPPSRIILGLDNFSQLKKEIGLPSMVGEDDRLIFMGMKISLSRRRKYVRFLPEKMKYRSKYMLEDYISENL